MGLCFSGFFFFSTTIFSAGGLPTRSRANSLTAVTARNRFDFFFLATFGLGCDPASQILIDDHRPRTTEIPAVHGRWRLRKCAIITFGRAPVLRCSYPMEERDFFDERQEKKPASLNCPHCHQSAEYEVTWVVRTKKRQLAGRADERDRARFAKFRSYMVRKDDMMACKNMRCRKRFEISGQSTVIME